jgi:hypothetical protein
MMLLSLPDHDVLVGLAFHKSLNVEHYDVANKIERLLSKEG